MTCRPPSHPRPLFLSANLALVFALLGVCPLHAPAQTPAQHEQKSPPPPAALPAQDLNAIRIQILDGKTGRPITNQHLLIMRPDGRALDGGRNLPSLTTDGEGYAPIPTPDPSVPNLVVNVDLHRPCSKTGVHTFPLARIHSTGVVSENTCRPRIKLYPQPGTLVFFVRPETFLEKIRH
jgi:hypothetical protein